MNEYDELKLAIYESGLDWEDCELMIDALESCEYEDEFLECVDDILTILEATKEEADEMARRGKLQHENDVLNRMSNASDAKDKKGIKYRRQYLKTMTKDPTDPKYRQKYINAGLESRDKYQHRDLYDKNLARTTEGKKIALRNNLERKTFSGNLKSDRAKRYMRNKGIDKAVDYNFSGGPILGNPSAKRVGKKVYKGAFDEIYGDQYKD